MHTQSNRQQYRLFNAANGSVLIEWLSAMTIGLLLIGSVLDIYLTASHTYQLEQALNQNEANATRAIDLLQSDIHRAGWVGCAKLTDGPISPHNRLWSDDDGRLTVRYMNTQTATVSTMPDVEHIVVTNDNRHTFAKGETLIIADCTQAEALVVKDLIDSASSTVIVPAEPLHHHYAYRSLVGAWQRHTFFSMDTKRKDEWGWPIYALYEEDEANHKNELVEDITAIHFTYSRDAASVGQEVTVQAVRDWSKVVGVAMALTVQAHFKDKTPVNKTWYSYVGLS